MRHAPILKNSRPLNISASLNSHSCKHRTGSPDPDTTYQLLGLNVAKWFHRSLVSLRRSLGMRLSYPPKTGSCDMDPCWWSIQQGQSDTFPVYKQWFFPQQLYGLRRLFLQCPTMLYITMGSYGSMWLCHKITQGNSHAECARLINPLSMYFNLTEMYWHAFSE